MNDCATFSKSLNPRIIDKGVSDIRFLFESSFWISVSGCKLTIPLDIQLTNWLVIISVLYQRCPESLFQTPTPLLFQNFWIRVRQFFKFENPTPVQTPATMIDPTEIYPCFYLRNDHTECCYCRNPKVTPDSGPFFPKFLTPGPKEKLSILPESTPALRIRSHLCFAPLVHRYGNFAFGLDPKFFMNSISNPYLQIWNCGLRYPIQIRNRPLSCTWAKIFGSVYFAVWGRQTFWQFCLWSDWIGHV